MAVKTFTTGEVLTASDTNTYLNNGGLVYITETSASNSASVVINNCFSTTFDAYRIVITNWTASVASSLVVTMTGTATGYYYSTLSVTNAGAISTATTNNNTSWANLSAVANTSGGSGAIVEIQNPFLAANTMIQVTGGDNRTNGEFIRQASGYLANTTSYTGFTMSSSNGNTTCKIVVYGYRKA